MQVIGLIGCTLNNINNMRLICLYILIILLEGKRVQAGGVHLKRRFNPINIFNLRVVVDALQGSSFYLPLAGVILLCSVVW